MKKIKRYVIFFTVIGHVYEYIPHEIILQMAVLNIGCANNKKIIIISFKYHSECHFLVLSKGLGESFLNILKKTGSGKKFNFLGKGLTVKVIPLEVDDQFGSSLERGR